MKRRRNPATWQVSVPVELIRDDNGLYALVDGDRVYYRILDPACSGLEVGTGLSPLGQALDAISQALELKADPS